MQLPSPMWWGAVEFCRGHCSTSAFQVKEHTEEEVVAQGEEGELPKYEGEEEEKDTAKVNSNHPRVALPLPAGVAARGLVQG